MERLGSKTLTTLQFFIPVLRGSRTEVRRGVTHVFLHLQLEKLLAEVRRVTLEGQKESVSSQCALFVCNKWDQVPKEEVKEVQNYVIRKLKKCWPGIDPESQITYMSTRSASTAQKHGIITKEFFDLMSGMRLMVLKSIKARIEMHWK